jgi:3D (Asp-Asp-Asp) domain-containing protein
VLSFFLAILLSFSFHFVIPSSARPLPNAVAGPSSTGFAAPADNGVLPRADAPPRNTQPIGINVMDGKAPPRAWITFATTVGDALQDANVCLGPHDIVTPTRTQPLMPGMTVVVKHVRYELRTEMCPLPFRTVFKMSADVSPGRITKGHSGKPGMLKKTFEAKFVNDGFVSRRLIAATVVRAPVNDETLAGIRVRMARALPSRGGLYQRLRCIDMVATGYSPHEGSCTGRCATGMPAGYGVVAVDPRIIRLGAKLYIEGYGYAVAGDVGSAIKGRRIDLGHTTHREASNVGRRGVRVWILAQQ